MWVSLLPTLAFSQMEAVDDFPFTDEEVPIALNVVANDINSGGGILTVTLLSSTVNGLLELVEADQIVYTPFLNYFGTDTFSYEVCNGEEPVPACDIGFVLITVFPVPDYPVANDDFVSLPAQTAIDIDVLSNDINVDSEALEALLIASPSHGSASVNESDNTIHYSADSSFAGLDTLQYAACKSGSTEYCDTAFVFITVTTTNFNAPLAVNDLFTTTLYQTGTYEPLLNDADADGDALWLHSIFYSGISGTVSQSGNTITYTTAAKKNDTLDYIVCDSNTPSLCDTGTIVFQVLNIKIPDSFSPNGDGINDYLVIEGLEAYPQSSFTIYNRWGDVVFDIKHPESVLWWDGFSNVTGSVLFGSKLAEGTYYYVFNPGNGSGVQKGYIVLKR